MSIKGSKLLLSYLGVDDAKVHAGAVFRPAAAHHHRRQHSVVLTPQGTGTFVYQECHTASIIQWDKYKNELTFTYDAGFQHAVCRTSTTKPSRCFPYFCLMYRRFDIAVSYQPAQSSSDRGSPRSVMLSFSFCVMCRFDK